MDRVDERIETMFKGRLWISLVFGIGVLVVAALVNVDVILPIAVIVLTHLIFNQPWLWTRLFGPSMRTLIRVHLYLDIIIVTGIIHFFGGTGSGPLIAVYLLFVIYASVAVGAAEGLRAAVASLFLFLALAALEINGHIASYEPLFLPGEDLTPRHLAAILLSVTVIFVVPAFVGMYINRFLVQQDRDSRRIAKRSMKIFNDARDPFVIIDGKGRVLQANQSADDLFNAEDKAILGEKLSDLVSTESSYDFVVMIENLSSGETVSAKDLTLTMKDGEEKVLELHASPLGDGEEGESFMVLRDVTERHRMEEELRRYSEELYRRVEDRTAELEESREIYMSMFEKAAVPLCWLNYEGVLQSANSLFRELTGLSGEDEGSKELAGIIAGPEDRERVREYLDLHRKGYEAPSRMELQISTEKGIFWTEWFVRFEPLTDQILVSMIDVSERRKAEEEVRKSEERFRLLFDRTFDAIIMTDREGKIADANEAAARLLGYDKDDLLSVNLLDFVLPRDRQVMMAAGNRALEKGTDYHGEISLVAKDGRPRTVEAGAVKVELGGNDYILASFHNVTEKTQAERALKESERRYRTLVETSPDAITLTDVTGKIIMLNRETVRIHGAQSEEDLLGMDAVDLIVPEERQRAIDNTQETLEQGTIRNAEYRMLKMDGSVFSGEISASLIKDQEGEPFAFIGVVRDITERKEAEDKLRKYREELENQVQDRTRELHEQSGFLETVINAAYDGIFVVDKNGKYMLVNPASRILAGDAPENWVGKRAGSTIHPDDIEKAARALIDAFQDKTPQLQLRAKGVGKEYRTLNVKLTSLEWKGDKHVLGVSTDVTDIREAEREKQESEQRYSLLAENINDVIWTMDLDTTLTYISPSCRNILGFEPEEMLKMTVQDLFPQRHVQTALEALREEFELEKDPNADPDRYRVLEMEQYTKRGSTIWIEATTSFLRDRDGKVIGIVGVTRDATKRVEAERELERHRERLEDLVQERTADLTQEINERRRAEEEAKRSEEKYRTLFEDSIDTVYISSREGKIIEANESAVRLSGYTREELIGMEAPELYQDPDDRKRFQEEIEKKGAVKDFEINMTAKGGRAVDAIVTASIRRDGEGNVVGYQGIIRDVTEKRKSEEALKKSEEYFRSLIENASDLITIIDPMGKVVYESPSVKNVLGFTPEELIGENAFEYVHPEDKEDLLKRFMEAFSEENRKGRTVTFEFRSMHKDGSWRTLEATATNMLDDPLLDGFVVNSRDVTERREMEKREDELKNELAAAKEVAMAGKFAAGVAHEMNNPLTAVSYYAQALEKSKRITREDRERIALIKDSVQRIQGLISGLISFASVENAKFEKVNLNDVVTQALDSIAHELESRPETLVKTELEESLPDIKGATTHLFHLVTNLLINAMQALKEEKGSVKVKTESLAHAARLTVSDTGEGIKEEDMEKIFSPFFTRKSAGKGAGLGLAIVSQIARVHGAELIVNSKPGEGTGFIVDFPVESKSGKKRSRKPA